MALSKKLTLKSNFNQDSTFDNTYIKVQNYFGNKNQMSFEVNTYDSKDGVLLNKQNYTFALDMQGDNPIRQAYKHLKTLPEFAGATDC